MGRFSKLHRSVPGIYFLQICNNFQFARKLRNQEDFLQLQYLFEIKYYILIYLHFETKGKGKLVLTTVVVLNANFGFMWVWNVG